MQWEHYIQQQAVSLSLQLIDAYIGDARLKYVVQAYRKVSCKTQFTRLNGMQTYQSRICICGRIDIIEIRFLDALLATEIICQEYALLTEEF